MSVFRDPDFGKLKKKDPPRWMEKLFRLKSVLQRFEGGDWYNLLTHEDYPGFIASTLTVGILIGYGFLEQETEQPEDKFWVRITLAGEDYLRGISRSDPSSSLGRGG